jgi:hypothetical protein
VGAAVAALAAALGAVALAVALRRRHSPGVGDQLERLLGGPDDGAVLPRTLRDLSEELDRRVGPHTSALALEAERARFGRESPAKRQRTAFRVVRALARDLGPWRAALLIARRSVGSTGACRPAGRSGLALGPGPRPRRRT